MNIVLFGGSGFLGSHVCDKLSDADMTSPSSICALLPICAKTSVWSSAALLDEELVNTVVSGADAVFDFAGLADIGEANQKPVETAASTYSGT